MSSKDDFDKIVAQKKREIEEAEKSSEVEIAQFRQQAEEELLQVEQRYAQEKSQTEKLVELLKQLSESTGGRLYGNKLVAKEPKIQSNVEQYARYRDTPFKDEYTPYKISHYHVYAMFSEKRKVGLKTEHWTWFMERTNRRGSEEWSVFTSDNSGNFDSVEIGQTEDAIAYLTDRFAADTAREEHEAVKKELQDSIEAEKQQMEKERREKAYEPAEVKRRFNELLPMLDELRQQKGGGQLRITEEGELPHVSVEISLSARIAWLWPRRYRRDDEDYSWTIRSLVSWDDSGKEISVWELSEYITDWQKIDHGNGVELVTYNYESVDELTRHLKERVGNELRRRKG